MSAAPREIADPGPRPRYGTRPLPAYRFVPGLHPHPTRDPGGHSYGAHERAPRRWTPEEWPALEDWLAGVDLFNAHYFWEAHEAWEGLWATQPRASSPALFLQGLIQIAAALLKQHLGSEGGARTLAGEGLAKLRRLEGCQPRMMGLDLGVTIAALAAHFETPVGALPDLARAPLLRLDPP